MTKKERAAAVTELLRQAILRYPEVFRFTKTKLCTVTDGAGKPLKMVNHNNILVKDKLKILNEQGESEVDGLKTGYIDAGGSSIILTGARNGKRAIVVVVGSQTSKLRDQLTRIGKVELPPFNPILGSVKTKEYRNKLEFGCCNRRWFTKEELQDQSLDLASGNHAGIGFHITGAFDKIYPINRCWLMDDLHNQIRNEIARYAKEIGMTFYDVKAQKGVLRNLMFRNSNTGEWMLLIQFHYDRPEDEDQAKMLMQHIADMFPQISSLIYVDNQKGNDTIGDLELTTFKGTDFIYETMEDLKFKVGPKSFYQTNTEQAYHLYSVARNFAFEGQPDDAKPLIYDLYTGTGTIANFVARKATKVIGIEYVPEAIEDAKVNSRINNITNTEFYAGDMRKILTDDFIRAHGRPDIIITDPPRAGMHPDVVNVILNAAPSRIVYVSCNPATQARDLALLDADYRVEAVQPVDMFPHTPHVENVVLLKRRG